MVDVFLVFVSVVVMTAPLLPTEIVLGLRKRDWVEYCVTLLFCMLFCISYLFYFLVIDFAINTVQECNGSKELWLKCFVSYLVSYCVCVIFYYFEWVYIFLFFSPGYCDGGQITRKTWNYIVLSRKKGLSRYGCYSQCFQVAVAL